MKLSTFLLLVVAVFAFGQDPDAAAQKQIIADVKAKALDYLKNGPNFICTEVARRNVDASGTNTKWKLVDTIHERITFIGQKEDFEVLSVGGKKPGNPESHPNGVMPLAEFDGVLAQIFDPKVKGQFSWGKIDSLRGHRINEIAYKIDKENSVAAVGKKDLTVGLLGVIDADADTGAVLHISTLATDIPAKYPIQGVATDFHWEYMKVGDQVVLVPLKADVHEKEGRTLTWNEIEFRDFQPEALKKIAR